jgi:hypothetical protein
MDTPLLISTYINWHYGVGLQETMMIWKNSLQFGFNFFSLKLLFKTLFKPLYRIHEGYGASGLNLEVIFQNLALNMVARGVGFLMRAVVIVLGLLFVSAVALIGPILLAVWLALPLLVPASILTGLFLLI